MKKIFLAIVLVFLSSLAFAQNPEPAKEIKISLDSKYYNSASGVIIGFFKQAKINNYYIDEKLEKDPSLNFRFREKTIKETLDILSRVYSIDFEITEKKDFYFVKLRSKK